MFSFPFVGEEEKEEHSYLEQMDDSAETISTHSPKDFERSSSSPKLSTSPNSSLQAKQLLVEAGRKKFAELKKKREDQLGIPNGSEVGDKEPLSPRNHEKITRRSNSLKIARQNGNGHISDDPVQTHEEYQSSISSVENTDSNKSQPNMEELEKNLEELKSEIEEKKRLLDGLEETIAQEREEKEKMKEDFEKKEQEWKESEEKMEKQLHQAKRELHSKVGEFINNERKSTEVRTKELEQENQSLMEEVELLRRTNENLKRGLEENDSVQKEKENDATTKSQKELKQQLALKAKQNRMLQEQLDFLEDEAKIYKKQCSLMKETMEKAQEAMANKDMMMNSSGKSQSMIFSANRGARDYDKLQEKTTALQAHNWFLTSEIKSLELEKQIRLSTIDKFKKQISQLRSELENSNHIDHFETLKKKYFLSLVLGVKLSSQNAWFSNLDSNELYDKVQEDEINFLNWPEWVANQIFSSKTTEYDLNPKN